VAAMAQSSGGGDVLEGERSMSETLKIYLCVTGLFVIFSVFYYAQEMRRYRYLEHEAAMEKIAEAQP